MEAFEKLPGCEVESGVLRSTGQKVFQVEYGCGIEEFLDSIYSAGTDLSGSDIEHHAKCIERSHKMLRLLESALDLLQENHQKGENYYWILYYTYFIPQKINSAEEIMAKLQCHTNFTYVSVRSYYRLKKML